MTFTFIGFIVGIVMGLTGAGGALISIPLFLSLLDTSLKEATVLSLLAVMMGTSVNLWGNLHKLDNKIVITFSVFGVAASFLASGWKNLLPEIMVAALLLMIAVYSLWSVWKTSDSESTGKKTSLPLLIFTGLFLGAVTTFTGLGGGVLLIPLLMRVFGKTYEEALPTSLASILFISLGSFLIQLDSVTGLFNLLDVTFMLLGSAGSYIGLKLILKKISQQKTLMLRKSVFTLVTVYAIGSVIAKTLGDAL